MKFRIKGSIQPPRGTPGANGAYIVDLDLEVPNRLARMIEAVGAMSSGVEIPGELKEFWALTVLRSTERAGTMFSQAEQTLDSLIDGEDPATDDLAADLAVVKKALISLRPPGWKWDD